jgi:hypothetical protein
MRFSRLYLLVLFSISLNSCAQENKKDTLASRRGYTIDNSLKKVIEKKKLDVSRAALDIQWLENNKEAAFPLSGKGMSCYTFYTLNNDTIRITAMTLMGPVGIAINLYKDSVWIFHFVASKDKSLRSFKKNITDKEYQYGPDAPAKSYKLIFTKEPKPNEPIEGYVEFESVEFYQKWTPTDLKRTYNAKGYFRATYQ